MANDVLTAKQALFVEEYLVDLNATAAAKRAGYKKPESYGPQLLHHPCVAEAIRKAKEERAERTAITADRVVQELAKVAFSNMKRLATWRGGRVEFLDSDQLSEDDAACIEEVSETVTESGGSHKIKLHNKLKALELLGRHLGVFEREKGADDPHAGGEAAIDARVLELLREDKTA